MSDDHLLQRIKQELRRKISSFAGLQPLSSDANVEAKKIYEQKLIKSLCGKAVWLVILFLPILLLTFWMGTIFHPKQKTQNMHEEHDHKSEKDKIKFWTCSMHPQIKLPTNDAKCPICFMDLVPVHSGGADVGATELSLSENALKLAKIETEPALYRKLTHTLRMVGKVDYDETKVASVSLWTPGKSKLIRMLIAFTGANVKKGTPLVEVYSPDLIAAQGEYLSAYNSFKKFSKNNSQILGTEDNVKASERKLIDLGMTISQIKVLQERNKPDESTIIYSPVTGTVIGKLVNEGEWHSRGMAIYRIADLSKVWVKLEAYETDINWIRHKQEVHFETEAYPGRIFKGHITFIDPFLNKMTRTVPLRVDAINFDGELKPGMFVTASVKVKVAEGGEVADYAKKPSRRKRIRRRVLSIPYTAPLITGKRAIVYVQEEKKKYNGEGEPKVVQRLYHAAEVKLGPRAGNYYVVLSGLEEGQMVVTQGAFKIDSALQIMAKPSMMNPGQKKVKKLQAFSQNQIPPYAIAGALYHKKMKQIIDPYLDATKSLATDNLENSYKHFLIIKKEIDQMSVKKLDLSQISEEKIKGQLVALKKLFLDFEKKKDIKYLREIFGKLSPIITSYMDDFGHTYKKPLYLMFCPMIDNHWWQTSEELKNPYYGAMMLRCGDKKKTHKPLKANQIGKIAAVSGRYWDYEALYHKPMKKLVDSYLAIGNIMSKDSIEGIYEHKKIIAKALSKIKVKKMLTHPKIQKKMARQLYSIKQTIMEMNGSDINVLRRDYLDISNALIRYVEDFGHLYPNPLYIMHCPMYRHDMGGFWIQNHTNVSNPYFGSQMFHCGDVERNIPSISHPKNKGE